MEVAPLHCTVDYSRTQKRLKRCKRDSRASIVGCQTSAFAPSARRLLHCFLLKLGNNYHRLQQTATNCQKLLKRADEELIRSWWRADEELMKDWQRTDKELMKNWWRTDEELMKNWWRAYEELMKSWWRADEELMQSWWRADEELMMTDWDILYNLRLHETPALCSRLQGRGKECSLLGISECRMLGISQNGPEMVRSKLDVRFRYPACEIDSCILCMTRNDILEDSLEFVLLSRSYLVWPIQLGIGLFKEGSPEFHSLYLLRPKEEQSSIPGG